jgi:hypothetical protein
MDTLEFAMFDEPMLFRARPFDATRAVPLVRKLARLLDATFEFESAAGTEAAMRLCEATQAIGVKDAAFLESAIGGTEVFIGDEWRPLKSPFVLKKFAAISSTLYALIFVEATQVALANQLERFEGRPQ